MFFAAACPCRSATTQLLDGKNLRYLGPIRYEPRRVYLASDLSSHQWEAKGQSAIKDFLLKDLTGKQKEKLDFWFHELGLSESLTPKRLVSIGIDEESSEAVQLNFDEGGPIKSINIKDVGQGAAQVLPVVLQTLFAPTGAFIIVEQPELHLHPEAQAILADLFISQIEQGQQFLIETHSEHILLRLLLRIAKGTPRYLEPNKQRDKTHCELDKLEFGLVFVTRDRKQGLSHTEWIQADEQGQLKGLEPVRKLLT